MSKFINLLSVMLVVCSLFGCDLVKDIAEEELNKKKNELLGENTKEILIFLKTGDEKRLGAYAKEKAACELLKDQLDKIKEPSPLYIEDSSGTCLATNVRGAAQENIFSDKNCTQSVLFQSSNFQNYCKEIVSIDKPRTVLGNAAVWEPSGSPINNAPTQKWTLPYGVKMKLTNESISENSLPYMKRVNYKTIQNVMNSDGSIRGNGTCKLEMRVYKRDVSATNLQPLLSIHGGSWKLRLAGFPGMESSISHLTEQGFIVFAPFYRLIGEKEGNQECNNVTWKDTLSDVEDALKWVWKNAEVLGAAREKPVALTGQSAGAHLSMWLLAHPERHHVPISRALLLYPPTDFKDFVSGAVTGGKYANYSGGIKTFESYFGVSDIADVSEQALAANSFPSIVARNLNMPPVFIIHGVADKVVPSMQSVRLCNAYERNVVGDDYDIGPAVNDGGDLENKVYMKKYSCGSKGFLYLLAEADHALDLKCVTGACSVGSKQSVPALKEALNVGRGWLIGED